MIVLDANVLVNVFVVQPLTHVARAVAQEDFDWRAPLLWRSELRNALVTMCRASVVSWSEAVHVMGMIQGKMREREYHLESRAVLRFARERRCSAYDAEYGVLAEQLDVPLVTWDQTLLRALPGRALTPEAFVRRK